MAATFLGPQPRDSASLLQQRSSRRRYGHNTFLRREPAFNDEVDQQGRSSQPVSFLRPASQSFGPTSSAVCSDEPRTIAAEKLLSTYQRPLTSPQATSLTQPTTFLRASLDKQHSSRDITTSTDPAIMAPSAKIVPPHLRSKPSTRTDSDRGVPVPKEKTASLQDSAVSVAPRPPLTQASTNEVREKLSELGVKVGSPKRGTASTVNVADTTGDEPTRSHRGRGRGARGAPHGMRQLRNAESSTQHNDEPGRPISPAYRGRGRGGRQARSSRWPTKKEFSKPQSEHNSTWESDAGNSIDSLAADFGLGDQQKKRAPAGARGFKLTDWNGGWAPAPIDWDARPGFRDPTKVASIERWMQKIEDDLDGLDRAISRDLLTTNYEHDLAPLYWVPIIIGNQAPTSFFSDILASGEPNPIDETDLIGVKPWWDLYNHDPCVQEYAPPLVAGVDKDETLDERLARENDHGADNHIANKKRTEKARQEAKREKRQKAEKRAQEKSRNVAPDAYTGGRIKPGLNMYVRSARPSDMVQIRDIYNHYVDFTCCVPETEKRTTADMQQRYERAIGNSLPFLVACERGAKVTCRRTRKMCGDGEDIILPERVVGFATADDFQDMLGMYRFTCEVEVYVNKEYYMKGIAKCLLDKLMALLDPTYVERGGFDIQGEELEGVGPSRVIQNILVHVPYERPERLEWTTRWLSSMQFNQMANLTDIGNKIGKSVSLAMFMRKAGAVIDAANPPIKMS